MKPTIILLNGASSAGKTSIARELQRLVSSPYLHAQVDTFTQMLPPTCTGRCLAEAAESYPNLMAQTFHATVANLIQAGANVIVDHVLGENKDWIEELHHLTRAARVISVGVHCDLPVLIAREGCRSDRNGHPDIATRQYHTIHRNVHYDLNIDTTHASPTDCAREILAVVNASSSITAQERSPRPAPATQDPSTPSGPPPPRRGCVQVYTGNGKGKTTAALGLAMRAGGANGRVLLGQFIKARATSEIRLIKKRLPEITIEQYGCGMIRNKAATADRVAARLGLARLHDVMVGGTYDLVIADEINVALANDLIPLTAVLDLIKNKPLHVELVLTGRTAHPAILEKADLVTEMKCLKHPLANGIAAREGIEF